MVSCGMEGRDGAAAVVVVEADEDEDGLPAVWSDDASAAAAALTFPRRLTFEFVCASVERGTALPTSALLRPRGEEKRGDDEEEEQDNAETTMPPRLLPASLLCCCCCCCCCCSCCSTRGDTEAAHGERAARAAAALISIRFGERALRKREKKQRFSVFFRLFFFRASELCQEERGREKNTLDRFFLVALALSSVLLPNTRAGNRRHCSFSLCTQRATSLACANQHSKQLALVFATEREKSKVFSFSNRRISNCL